RRRKRRCSRGKGPRSMKKTETIARVLALTAVFGLVPAVRAQDKPKTPAWWPQIRGAGGPGGADRKKRPLEVGPTNNLLWKTPLPPGHSSPCVWGDRIVVTAYDKSAKKLETICLSRDDGKILWHRPAPAEKIEAVHVAGSPAVATPVADGERV